MWREAGTPADVMGTPPRPELAGLQIADPPERWQALGFTVDDGRLEVGGIAVELGGPGSGIVGWTLRHVDVPGGPERSAGLPSPEGSVGPPSPEGIDGLPTTTTTAPPRPTVAHPNEVVTIDHVVVMTPDFDRTALALASAGMSLRRIRDAGSFRQGFRRLGPAILELVEARGAPPGPARFWGLVLIVPDLEALSERISPHLGEIRPAVQPGRHIATLDRNAGLSPRVAFMDPE